VLYRNAENRFSRRQPRRRFALLGAVSLLACLGAISGVHAASTHTSSRQSSYRDPSPGPLTIQVNNDRLTLTVAKAPQIYLAGVIDADAPRRFDAMVRAGKITAGSDVYLNASGNDMHAAIALGRLFREGSITTHLGTQRLPRQSGSVGKPAMCTGTCAYAYLGGLYRWAPTGADRIGFPTHPASDPAPATNSAPTQQSPDELAAYLKDMDIDPATLAPLLTAAQGDTAWLTADQMIASRLANNGRLPLIATYQVQDGAPNLQLNEVKRGGEHRMTLQCRRDGVLFTAYNAVGGDHARQIVARSSGAFVEINRTQGYATPSDNPVVQDQAIVITHLYPGSQLGNLITADTVGAWVRDRSSTLRYGFEFELKGLNPMLKKYYQSCWEYAPWQVPQKG
jgi:hypothetical protein